ncbi:lipid A deacylase LpxR family protein [Flavobacteriaceae bacterium]|nr:lipid A deacylase LpxR family protein [Flavobacteriaceae bacterium]
MKRLLLIVFCVSSAIQGMYGQEGYFNLSIDNDFFFVNDIYYTSGIFLQYGKEVKKTCSDSLRHYDLWELGQEIYTPSDRYSENTADYDYPYGGWAYLKYSRQKELSPNKQFEVGLQFGFTGDWSLGRWFQNTYHREVLGLAENAWVDQVPDAVHVNLFVGYFHQKELAEQIHFQGHIYGRLGTQRTDIGARLGLNLGLAKALGLAANTGYFTTPGQAFYFGIDSAYIAHDYMITGSLFNEEAPFTSELVPFRLVVETGFALQGEKWKFLFLYKNRSPDNTLQPKKSHHLMTLSLSRFFD